ncbi:nucleotide exchange factor GrpE [Candidatus Campbellbacteria bacterium CG11_big_fil_rev_8_21_14_0_20_44_21]|nr:MAG: nucleotide exchange factor GrpE [Candidatus Campbellbacteria bacterium CG11_big_fil_rev_8_21_14_0_20_44_21]
MTGKDKKNKDKSVGTEAFADDVSVEAEEAEESSFGGNISKLRERLKKCVAEKQEYLAGWQRAKADFINYKKAEDERFLGVSNLAKEAFVGEILPVLDSFHLSRESEAWDNGLRQVNKQLLSILEKNGLEIISPEGRDFDPNLHEAVEMVEGEEEALDGKVFDVIQKGYKLNGRLVRPARVRVKIFKTKT